MLLDGEPDGRGGPTRRARPGRPARRRSWTRWRALSPARGAGGWGSPAFAECFVCGDARRRLRPRDPRPPGSGSRCSSRRPGGARGAPRDRRGRRSTARAPTPSAIPGRGEPLLGADDCADRPAARGGRALRRDRLGARRRRSEAPRRRRRSSARTARRSRRRASSGSSRAADGRRGRRQRRRQRDEQPAVLVVGGEEVERDGLLDPRARAQRRGLAELTHAPLAHRLDRRTRRRAPSASTSVATEQVGVAKPGQLEHVPADRQHAGLRVADDEPGRGRRVVVLEQLEQEPEAAAAALRGLGREPLEPVDVDRALAAVRADEDGHAVIVGTAPCLARLRQRRDAGGASGGRAPRSPRRATEVPPSRRSERADTVR